MEEDIYIPERLEVLITKDDLAILGTDGYIYDNSTRLDDAIVVPREEVDPEFDFNIDMYRVFRLYIRHESPKVSHIRVPHQNTRVHFDGLSVPEDIREYLNIDG